jgi:hypothetical protein
MKRFLALTALLLAPLAALHAVDDGPNSDAKAEVKVRRKSPAFRIHDARSCHHATKRCLPRHDRTQAQALTG